MRNRMSVSRCCCGGDPADCSTCATEIPAELTVDIGAGGWTDGSCDVCDDMVGEIVVTNTTNCTWLYDVPVACDTTASCDGISECPQALGFRVRVLLLNLGFTVIWQVWCEIYGSEGPSCPDTCVYGATARYETAELPIADCADLPVTLNRISQNVSSGSCGGSLPLTITLST